MHTKAGETKRRAVQAERSASEGRERAHKRSVVADVRQIQPNAAVALKKSGPSVLVKDLLPEASPNASINARAHACGPFPMTPHHDEPLVPAPSGFRLTD